MSLPKVIHCNGYSIISREVLENWEGLPRTDISEDYIVIQGGNFIQGLFEQALTSSLTSFLNGSPLPGSTLAGIATAYKHYAGQRLLNEDYSAEQSYGD